MSVSSSVAVRVAETDDEDLVRGLRARIHQHRPDGPDRWWGLADAKSRHWVAWVEEVPVGCASLLRDLRTIDGRAATHRLRWLGVLAEHRGCGVGRALVAVRLDAAYQEGAIWAWAYARAERVSLFVALGAVADPLVYDMDGSGPHQDVRYGPLPVRLPV